MLGELRSEFEGSHRLLVWEPRRWNITERLYHLTKTERVRYCRKEIIVCVAKILVPISVSFSARKCECHKRGICSLPAVFCRD